MKNNKGIGLVAGLLSMYAGSIIVLGVASAVSHNPSAFTSFRHKKAQEYCVAEGKSAAECETTIAAMDDTQVYDYIKDTQERPRG